MRSGLVLVALALFAPVGVAQGLLASPHTGICFLDLEGDGVRAAADPVYLQVAACGAGIGAGDARLVSWAGFQAGTLVTGADDDAGRTTAAVAAGYGFLDEDGNGAHSPNDDVVLHFGPLPGAVAPGDIPLSGPDAFRPIPGSDPRIGSPLLAAAVAVSGESYAERDGSAGFTVADVVYLDLDANGFASIGDLRLAGPAGAPSSTPPASSTTAPETAPVTGTSTGSPSGTTNGSQPETSGSTGTPAGSQGTPGAGLVATCLALAVAFLGRRVRPSH